MTPILILFFLIPVLLSLTPWQLFQQMCGLVSPNSQQCFRTFPQQQQQQQPTQPLQQQQQYPYNYTIPSLQPQPQPQPQP
jgi:hypothetical protein